MKTSAALICVRCDIPIRSFPAAVFDGSVILTAEVPFRNRLAYRCTRCEKFSCACCCHPPELVKAMVKPDAIGLPHDFSTPFPGAACPACRGMVRPLEQDEVGKHFDKSKPLTLGQLVFVSIYSIFTLLLAVAALTQGAWFMGVLFLCGCISGTAGILRAFAK